MSNCQGDGLNIEGKINLYDFAEKWETDEKSRRTIEHYIDNSFSEYTFESNNRYCYSCKFIDRKYIDDTIMEFIDDLKYNGIRGIKTDVIKAFFKELANRTRKSRRISESRQQNIMAEWEGYDVDVVMESLSIYLKMDTTAAQNERYLKGIMRNKQKEKEAAHGQSRKDHRAEQGTAAGDEGCGNRRAGLR